jgi:hypothetical protein
MARSAALARAVGHPLVKHVLPSQQKLRTPHVSPTQISKCGEKWI